MAPWLPFLLLPLFFAGLAGAMVWLPPKTAEDAATEQAPHPDVTAPTPAASPASGYAPPRRIAQASHPLATPRERPKHGTPTAK